jgi:hypothetical protein
MTMKFRFWKGRSSPKLLQLQAQSEKYSGNAEISRQTAAEKRRMADTDGTLRRMRQTVSDNRLL